MMMEWVNERLERHDGIINQLQGVPRKRRQPQIKQEEYDGRDDLEDDQITLVGHLRMQARRGCMEDVDHNLTSCSLPLCFIVRSWVRSFPMSTSVERVVRSWVFSIEVTRDSQSFLGRILESYCLLLPWWNVYQVSWGWWQEQ